MWRLGARGKAIRSCWATWIASNRAAAWLKRRDAALPAIASWAMDQKNMLRLPSGITHVVLDTPGGLHGFELARIVMFADAIVMPVCSSMFDRESAAALPRRTHDTAARCQRPLPAGHRRHAHRWAHQGVAGAARVVR